MEHDWVDSLMACIAVASIVGIGLLIGFVAMGGVR